MTDTRTLTGDEVVAQVSALVEEIFDRLKPVLAAAETLLGEPGGAGADTLHGIRPQVLEALGGLVIGAGFVSAPHVLSDQEFGFEWWTTTGSDDRGSGGSGSDDGGSDALVPEQLFISLDPESPNFLDYTRQSWFTVPRDSGRRHINGPYVDYLCTDEYTLTFTLPVYRDGSFAGVVGADVYVREFERTVSRRLRSLGRHAALLNAQGRVIVSNSVRQATGSLVRDVDVPAWWTAGAEPQTMSGGATLRRCGDSPIALLVSV
ncbi:cache domain-containing protein [Amycolatopsis rhabdoformis]|uniref:Cache domain-containing protein n=1 Tax=Amycolatopsis rhabdoformis TaxID=1448059 RepID=A0ABZ1I5D6_9PSEU|nr:cache domain-containing protein [Amycolatopsis rhabdoformis]WSE29595.1 cache domain-containing protein [Amycolatopsis rhabdoformis]